MNIQQFRQKYPQYAALDDEELTRRLYDRHYSDKLDPTEFRSRFLGRTPVDEQILPPAPVTAPETGAPAPVVAPEVPPSNFNGARPVQDMVADQQDQVIRPTAQGRSTAAGMLASTRQLAIAPARALNEKRQRDDEIDLARAEVMPEAVKFARANKINILDVPAVQAKAKELGMRPDAFIRGGAEYLAMTPEELAARKTGRTEAMSERSHRLSTAREMYKENQDEIAANRPTDAPIEAFFYDLGVAAPKLAGTVAAGMTTGPAGALAVMGTSVAPEFYNDGLDKGLSPEQASGYMMLMTAAELVPETFVFGKIFNKAAAAKTIKESVLATFGKRAFEAGALEAPSEMITEALQIGVEKGVFDQNTTLPEALKRIGYAGLMGFGMGVGLGAGPAAGAAGDQKKIELARRAQEAHERTLAETAAELSAVPMPQSLRKREAEHRAREAAQEVLDELTPTQLAKKKLDKLTRAATAGKVVDPKQLEEAREAYEQTVIESARDKLMSGELAPEQQQEAAQALQEIDAAPEDGAPRPVKGRVRTTEEAPAPAKPGPGGKPKATAPAALSEAETARHDALNRVAQADTIEGTDLETLIGQGLARVSPQGQPILLPAGRRQLKELTGRLDAAEAAKVTEVTEVTDKSRSVVKKTPVVAKKKQIVAKKPQAAETKNIPAPKKSATPPAALTAATQRREKMADLKARIRPLAEKGALSAEEGRKFRGLMQERAELVYEDAKPADDESLKIDPSESTLSPEVYKVASADMLKSRPAYMALSDHVAGVSFNSDTAVDDVMSGKNKDVTPEQFYQTFGPTRAALRKQYGDTVKLYRAEGKQKSKPVQNWATTEKFAKRFGSNVISKDVPVEDIIAANVTRNGKYHELIVGKKPLTAEAKIAALPAERRAKITARAEQLIEEELPKGAASMSEADQLGRDILDRPGMRDEQRRISEENRQKLLEGDALAQKPPGFEQDNPAQRGDENGRKWLAGKIKNVEEDMATAKKRGQKDGSMARGIGGSATAWVRDLDLPTDVLATIGGTNGEEKIRKPGEHQFDRLMETVRKEGFNQEKSPILVMVNHKGEAMIHEGNTRVAVAKAIGQKTVRAEVRYWNGGETVDGKLSPAKVAALAGGEEQLPKGAASVAEKVTAPDGPLLAPNGKPSKLSRTQWEQVRSPEFKNWFGDWEEFALIQGGVWNDSKKNVSKVVDRETGEPLVVYHGSPVAGFDTIRPGVRESTSIGQRVKAAFFTDNLDIAGTYSGRHANEVNLEVDEDPGPGYYPVFLNIRDPNEEHFGGANWDGSRQGQWAVFKTDDRGFYDPAEPEQVYAPDGTGYFTDRDEAFRLAMKSGGVADHAPDVGTSTNGVVAEAARYKQDGAIIRQVVDNGGRGESWEPSDVFVIFDPNQAKSATQNTGGFSKTDDRLAFALAPIFYSQLTRVAESAKLTKATGAQWYGALKNSPGVKQEELDWLGVGEWLGDRKGVTKQELVDYLNANELKVEEVVRGEGALEEKTADERLLDAATNNATLAGNPAGIDGLSAEQAYPFFVAAGMDPNRDVENLYDAVANAIMKRRGPKRAKYDRPDLTTPGGENYRELLLTLPKTEDRMSSAKQKLKALEEEVKARTGLTNGFDLAKVMNEDEFARYESISNSLNDARYKDDVDFVSGHFSEPNVIAHVRFNARADVEGGTTLFIEEIQSDWHQRGRKQGYRNSENKGWREDANVWVVYLPTDGTAVDVPKNLAASGPEAVRYAAAHRNELTEFVAKEQSTGVPDAPFKTTWPELMLKRTILWAAENGYDQVAWTTGDMQNERYDLSKHLDSVIVELYGTRGKAGTGTWNITGYKDGEDVVAERDIPREKVADFIGKDAADKAFAEIDANDDPNYNRAILTGLDLQVGGEGMRGFYDKILVAAADKIGKKYGSKTGTARISTPGAFTVHDRGLYAQLRWDVVDDNGLSQISTPFEDRPDAEDVAEALNLRTGVTPRQVHALRLTPELKAAALGGFPMFARGLPAGSQVTPAELRRATAYVEGAIGVRLQVRQRLSEAPQYVQDDLAAITAASRVQGYYFDGPHGPEVWLIGENLQDYDQAVEVAFHEAEHMGIRGLVGRPGTRGYNETMDRLWASFPAQGRVAAQRNKIDLTTGSDEFRLAKRRLAAEEMVAYAGGRLLQRKGTKDQRDVWQRIVDKFRDLMRQFGVGRYQKYNDADLNALIFRAIRKAGKVSAAQRKYVAEFWTAEAEGTTDYTPASVSDNALLGMPGETAIPGQGPVTIGPFAPARIAAQRYKRETGLGSYEVRTYQRVNESRARRIANAYQNMRHDPLNPKVRAAYDALAKETLAQYQAIKATGLKVEFIPKGQNPYAVSPRLAIEDVRNNNHLWVFPTDDGFGGADPDAEYLQNNPLLAETDEYVGQHRLLVNDVFRIVHDYFGHIQEGNGFRFDGEENAWRVHSAMYSPLARAAMTTETRGQNSWLNFGPFGEKNRTANQADTVYAEQKIGLLPEEFWEPDPEDGPGAAAAELESATFEDFRPENIGNILNRDRWAILTADNPGARPLPPAQNMRRWHRLRQELGIRKLRFIDAKGRYGNPIEENSFVVVGISEREAVDLGRRFGQESVLTRAGFVYMDGRPVTPATGVTVHDTAPKNFYTQIPKTGALFTVNLNFSGAGAMSVAKDEAAATVRRIAKHLSPEVRTSLNRGTAQKLVTMFDALPDEKEMGAVALAGLAKKGWYKDAAETLVNIFGPDAPRFAGLIAALSPRVHVQDNLKHAVNVWAGWVQAGRPADRKAIIDIMSKNLWNAKNRDGETVGVMPSWINNTVRALTHADPANLVLSGPKVDSFAANLRGEVNRVTLDSWMAAFANIKQSGLGGSINVAGTNPGKRPTYAAFEARVRQTAAYLTKKTGEVWTPAEVQETIWSWTKTLTEMAAEGGAMTSAREIVENGELTDELINATVDFTTLFAQPEHRQTLRDAGYGEQLDRADGAQAARAGARRQAPPPSRADRQRLLTAAGRIDQVVAGRRRTETEDVGDIAFSILGGNTGNQDLDEFLDKIGAPRRTLKQWWEDTTDNLRARIRFNLLDDLWGIGNAGNLAGVSLSDVGYKNAHLARSAAELTQALIEHGFPVWARDGTHELAEVDTSMGGLVDILKPLNGNVNLYLAWKVANRADRLMGEGRENLFTQAQIDAAKDLHLQHPEFLVVDRQFVAFQKKVLDFAEAAGIIDPAGRALWEHADYIPFYRIIESGQIKGPSAQSPLGKVRNQIRRLKGGRENLGDPLENLAKNWHSLMDASLKAHAARTVIDALDGSGLVTRAPQIEFTQAIVPLSQVKNFIKNNPLLAAHLRAAGIDPAKLPPAAFQGLQKMMAVQPPSGEDIISVWRGGKREYWHVHDELLFESLMNIPKAAWGPWMEFFRFPKRIFTATTTSTPQFGIRNFWRDMLHAFVQGAAGRNVTIVPGWDSVRGAVSQMRMDPAAVANLAGGGSFTHGYIRGGDMTGAANTVRRSLHKASPSQHVLDTPMKVVRFYRDLLNAAENTHRIAIRQRMLNAGASRLDATYESRDLLDFAKTGNSNIVRFIVQSVPFWNARLQGLDRLGRGAGGGKAVAAAIFMRGALYTMAVLALLAKYYDDERYKALADSDKANYLHFWDVIEDGDHWKMPVPFEVGTLFGTVPMAVFDYFVTNAEEPDRAKLSLKLLAHAFENTLNMRPDIRVVQPVLELAINKNLFTEAPILTMGDEAVLPEDQDDPRISPSYRLLSRLMPEAAPEALRSPKQLQHLGRGYIGNMQDYLLLVTDMAARRIMGEPAGAERSGPFSSSFRQTGPARSTRYSNTLYEVAEEADRVASSINRLEKAGTDEADARIEKLEAENEQLLDVRDDFVDAAKDVGELRKEMREIQLDPDLTSEEKREQMDELQQEINETAEDIFDLRPGGKLNENTISELIGRSVPEQQKILRNAGLPSTAAALG